MVENAALSSPFPKQHSRILKRVPLASRELAAKKLASIVSSASWCLRLPLRKGKRWNLVSAVNNLVRKESDALSTPGKPGHHTKRKVFGKSHDSLELFSSKVASMLEEGNYKVAVRLVCAVDVMADHSLETLEAWKGNTLRLTLVLP